MKLNNILDFNQFIGRVIIESQEIKDECEKIKKERIDSLDVTDNCDNVVSIDITELNSEFKQEATDSTETGKDINN